MKNTCSRCGKEKEKWEGYGLCCDCTRTENRYMTLLGIVFVLTVFGIVIGIRYLQAKFIYGDTKCIFAECRITK